LRPSTTHTTNPLNAFSLYRFHFNGKETDNEVYGEGNALDFGARTYDSRLGRWLSVDPLAAKYSDLSPYNFAGNCPILFIDIDGQKFVNPYRDKERVGKLEQNVATAQSVYNNLLNNENGNVTREELKSAKNALNSALAELEQNNVDAQKVDDFINTLKVSNESEYKYFETLRDGNGNEISIVVNVKNEQGPAKGKGYADGETPINPVITNGVYGVAGNEIQMTIYQSTNTITQTPTNLMYQTFANELGDIQYYFKNVKDKDSEEFWGRTADGSSPDYKDPNGAGEYSNTYMRNRIGDVKRTRATTDESGNIK
jgi:RHS repeat-associated protein